MNSIRRQTVFLAVLCLLCLGAAACGLAFGSKRLPFADVWAYLLSDGHGGYNALVAANRLPRTLAALFCGAALGLSGALMQGLTRNPLGDTGLLGINAGAAASIVSAAFFPSLAVSHFWLAIPGSLLVALLVCALGLSGRQSHYTRLVLAGSAIAASLYAYVQAVSQLDPEVFDHYRFWASGAFAGITTAQIRQMLAFFIPAAILALCLGRYVNIIALDKQIARSLGANIPLIQGLVLLSASVLAACAVALAGPVAFVGLGAAHLARRFTGNDYRFLLPASMFAGGLLLVCADVLARLVVAPHEIATGIVTSLLGAPLLYVMVLKQSKGRS